MAQKFKLKRTKQCAKCPWKSEQQNIKELREQACLLAPFKVGDKVRMSFHNGRVKVGEVKHISMNRNFDFEYGIYYYYPDNTVSNNKICLNYDTEIEKIN